MIINVGPFALGAIDEHVAVLAVTVGIFVWLRSAVEPTKQYPAGRFSATIHVSQQRTEPRMTAALLGVFVGFACGYGVREYIARRRRAAARKRFYDEHPDLRELRGPRASAVMSGV